MRRKEGSIYPEERWKDLNKPEQVKEPGTFTHAAFSGHADVCSSHSSISATGDVLNVGNIHRCWGSTFSGSRENLVLILYLCTSAGWSSTAGSLGRSWPRKIPTV